MSCCVLLHEERKKLIFMGGLQCFQDSTADGRWEALFLLLHVM